ncbi:MAG: rod shape-determining protein MreC [Phenylobacterium sp.]
MSYRDGHFQDLKVPLTWTVGVAVVVAIVAAVVLLLSDRRETLESGVIGVGRAAADVAASPVGQAIAAPGRWAGQATQYVKDYFFAVSENRRLRAENAELRQWKATAIALDDTNARYRALLGFRTNPPIPMAAAHVILDSRGPFADTRLADAGKEKGVEVGNPVMNERGLVGRVIGAAHGASRVLLLTDVASRTPVLIDRTDARAILTGDASRTPKLEYLRGMDPIKEGDRILSSGDGGMIPRGLPVGTAVKGLDGAWRVRLDADESSIDFVRILLFKDFSQLVNQQELAQPAPPPAAPPSPPSPPAATPTAAAPAKPAARTPAAVPPPGGATAVSVGAARPAPAPSPPAPSAPAPSAAAPSTADPSKSE